MFIGIASHRDRVGRHFRFSLGTLFSVTVVFHPAMWAGSAYSFKRRVWLRPIDYAALNLRHTGDPA